MVQFLRQLVTLLCSESCKSCTDVLFLSDKKEGICMHNRHCQIPFSRVLEDNQFDGPLPQSLGKLTDLERL